MEGNRNRHRITIIDYNTHAQRPQKVFFGLVEPMRLRLSVMSSVNNVTIRLKEHPSNIAKMTIRYPCTAGRRKFRVTGRTETLTLFRPFVVGGKMMVKFYIRRQQNYMSMPMGVVVMD